MHRRPLGREWHGDHLPHRAGVEQPLGERLHGSGPGTPAHPDQDGAVADHQDVAAFQRRGQRQTIAPDLMLDRREQRVVTVDGLQVQRLMAARRSRPSH